MKATIFNIQRFCVNDGPGIRTTVFFKGCPLRCKWCHNPESKLTKPQLMLTATRCIGCGECVKACEKGLHSFDGGSHMINRADCALCGRCVSECVGALEICGKKMSVDEVLHEVKKDKAFYDESGGGMTVSGGEPLLQHEFLTELVKRAKDEGIKTCIETCGYADWDKIRPLLQYIDIFLYDIKQIDDEKHTLFTGVSNEKILANLKRLSDSGARIIIRAPIIPGYNDDEKHLTALGELAEKHGGVIRVEVEPYHPLGKSKSDAIGTIYEIEDMSFAPDESVKEWINVISKATGKPVIKS